MKIIEYSSIITADLAGFIHENQGPNRLSSIKKIRQETKAFEGKNQIWIAQSRNRIMGYLWIVSGKKGTRGAHYQKPMYTSINELFIIPSVRRRTIGSQLLQTAHADGECPVFVDGSCEAYRQQRSPF